MTKPGDATTLLLQRAAQGDPAAVDELLRRHRSSLRRMIAVRMDPRLKTRIDPSDVVQSVLAEAAQKMVASPRQPEQFYPWLRQLAWDQLSRLHRDHVRTKKRSVSLEQQPWDAPAVDGSDRL